MRPAGGRYAIRTLLAVLAAAAAGPVLAQPGPIRVVIGGFTSAQSCTTYAVTSGRSAAIVTPWAIAWTRAWRTDLVRDCVNNFTGLRDSMAAALAASGHVVVVPSGTRGALVLTGRVSDVGTNSAAMVSSDMAQTGVDASVTVEFSLRNARGATVFGNSIAKRLVISSGFSSDNMSSGASQSDPAVYARLQRETAFAVARGVSFHVDPLRVIGVTSRRVRVNYGTPLLSLGAAILIDTGPAAGLVRCNVVSAGNGYAEVESEAGRDLSAVPLGSIATFAEEDDPAANGRRIDRVDLP